MLAGAIPTRVPQLPTDLERDCRLACPSRHCDKQSALALQNVFDCTIDGDLLVVTLALSTTWLKGVSNRSATAVLSIPLPVR